MKVLVVGAGMYVSGRGTSGVGTILPALAQHSRHHPIDRVTVVATRPASEKPLGDAVGRINGLLGSKLEVDYKAIDGNLADIARGGYDCAIVSVPDHLHFEVTRTLMWEGIHCLVVKPLTPTVAEANELLSLQADRNLHCAVEFHKRFDEQNLLVQRYVREGVIGVPRYLVVGYSQRIGIPLDVFRSWADRTNIFQYLGVHYVDLVHFLTGVKPVRISAVGTRGVLDAKGIHTWDSVHATIVWSTPPGGSSEFISQMAIGWIDPNSTAAMSDQRFFLVGSKGRLDLDQTDRGVTLVTGSGAVEKPNPYFSMMLPDGEALTFQGYGFKSIERFLLDIASLKLGTATPTALSVIRPSFAAGLLSTAVVSAANESLARNGEWREIDGTP